MLTAGAQRYIVQERICLLSSSGPGSNDKQEKGIHYKPQSGFPSDFLQRVITHTHTHKTNLKAHKRQVSHDNSE